MDGVWIDADDGFDDPPIAVAGNAPPATSRPSESRDLEWLFKDAVSVAKRDRGWGDLKPLIEWYRENRDILPAEGPMPFHSPGRRARTLSELNNQLSPQIVNPVAFYHSLDIEINIQGPSGPRVACGTLKADLLRIFEISKDRVDKLRNSTDSNVIEEMDFSELI